MNTNENEPSSANKGLLRKAIFRKDQYIVFLSAAITVALLLGLSLYFQNILTAIRKVFSAASSILIGLALAYVINVPLRPLERFWDKTAAKHKWKKGSRLKRPLCMIICILAMIGIVLTVIFMILPGLKNSFSSLADQLPEFREKIEGWFLSAQKLLMQYNISLKIPEIKVDQIADLIGKFTARSEGDPLRRIMDTTVSLLGGLLRVSVVLFVAIYLLLNKERAARSAQKILNAFLPTKFTARLSDLLVRVDQSFTSFITGQFFEAIIFGILCLIGTSILRMPYAGVVSALVGFTALIPIFGAFFGTAVGAFLILLVKPIKAVWFVIFILILQQLEDNLIYPKVVGTSVGLPGFWTLFAVMVGGNAFGLLGMVLGVPLFAVFYELFGQFVHNRLKSRGIDPKTIK